MVWKYSANPTPESFMDDSSKYALGLRIATGYNNELYFQLLKSFGDHETAWAMDEKEIRRTLKKSDSIINPFITARKKCDIDGACQLLERKGIGFVVYGSKEYPELLADIASPPPLLFHRGRNFDRIHGLGVAVIGARRATGYGRDIAEQFARDLGQQNITVISGLARGIDSAAHKGALGTPGGTVAVLGCGVDQCYPPENRRLMDEIAEQGAVISEYLPGTKPLAKHFPARNRIISGVSEAVVIVEADIKSGALITADMALEQGREVFAVPGSIRNTLSRGPHRLIKEGATLAQTAQDVLVELGVIIQEQKVDQEPMPLLDDHEKAILEQISFEPTHFDAITEKSEMPVANIAGILTMLELKGFLSKEPGNYFSRKM